MTDQDEVLGELLLAGIKAQRSIRDRKRRLTSPNAAPMAKAAGDQLAEWQPLLVQHEAEKEESTALGQQIRWLSEDGRFIDAHHDFGTALAAKAESEWAAKDRFFAWSICSTTYRKQLESRGYEPSKVPMPSLVEAPPKPVVPPFKHIGLDPMGPGFMAAVGHLKGREYEDTRYALNSLVGRSFYDGNRASRIPRPHWIISGDKPSALSVRDFLKGFAIPHEWTIGKGVLERIFELGERADFMVALSGAHVPVNGFNLALKDLYFYGAGIDPATGKPYEHKPFQMAGVQYGLEALHQAITAYAEEGEAQGIGCFVCDDMGLGKTIESMTIAIEGFAQAMKLNPNLMWSDFRVLVVSPAAMKIGWSREVEKLAPWLTTQVVRGSQAQRLWANVVILNPSLLQMEYDPEQWNDATGQKGMNVPSPLTMMALAIDWFALIGDESHQYKNYNAARTQAMLMLSRNVPVKLWLSGTPILNRPEEFTSQLEALGILDHLGGKNRFLARYGYSRRGPVLKELHLKLTERAYLRREKVDKVRTPEERTIDLQYAPTFLRKRLQEAPYADWGAICEAAGYTLIRGVVGQLPEKIRTAVPIQINTAAYLKAVTNFMEWYADNVKDLEDANERLARAARGRALVELIKIKWYCAKLKLPGAIELLRDFFEENPEEKVVYFCDHLDIHEEVCQTFIEEFGPEFVALIKGGQSETKRQSEVDRFQTDDRCKLIVCSIGAGSVAITLTAAKTVMFHELGWTPAIHDQAEDRVWGRLNDIHGANIMFLIAEKTIDEKVAALIDAKRLLVDAATEGSDAAAEGMVMALIEDIRRAAQAAG